MASSLFGNNRNQAPTQMPMANNPVQFMQQFRQFKQKMAGKDPKAIVNQLMSSGQMSQEQFNGLMQTAQMFKGFLGK